MLLTQYHLSHARGHGDPSPCANIDFGTAVTYDGNGNTLSYDVDGAGAILPRVLTYDGENRSVTATQNGNVSRFAYGPDGSRALKVFGAATRHFFGGEEVLVDAANPTGLLSSYIA